MSSLPRTSGIYCITCTANGKIYIGSSINLHRRWNEHRQLLRHNTHYNQRLQNAWNKYGETLFTFQVVELVDPSTLVAREQNWLDKLRSFDRDIGFNIARDTVASMKGRKLSVEHRAAISKAHKGKTLSEETRHRVSQSKIGQKLGLFSQEHRTKLSIANRGKSKSPDHVEKIAKTKRREFVVTSPDGISFYIKGMRRFCADNGLNNAAMFRVAQGKQTNHKGWKCRYA